MAGDRARVSYDPTRKWRGTVAQQGRVTVEADINEGATIADERDRLTTLDVVGSAGTPDGGYAVMAFPAGNTDHTPGDLQIGAGTLYLGGERLDLDAPVTYSTQPDWLDHSTDPLWVDPAVPENSDFPTSELITLHAIEVEVSATEDPALSDVALGGPDTMQRRRILQRFVRQPVKSRDCDGSWKEFIGWAGQRGLEVDAKSMLLGSTTSLQVSFTNTVEQPSPCEPVATGGFLGAENQLIRVMVTSVDPKSGVPTIVWGFDDASFLYRLTAATYDSGSSTTAVTLASSPADSFHFPAHGQAVELLRDAVQLTSADYIASATGFASTLTSAYDPTQMQLVIAGQPPDDYLSTTPQLYLRVWEGTAAAPAGQAIALGDTGLAVTLSQTGKSFNVGDFWTFAVRPINPAIVYPQRYLDAPQPPEGPRTWVCPLAVVTWSNGKPKVSSCVPPFDNLVKLTGASSCDCTVNVGPGDVADGAGLSALVASYANRGSVSICLRPGTYTLSEPIVLGGEVGLDDFTLRGCGDGVMLQAPQAPGPQFSLGLIVVEDGTSITIEDIGLTLPLVGFTPSSDAFSGLPEANQGLMAAFSAGLQLAFGISAAGTTTGLTVKDCAFFYPNPGTANVFGAGIYATGIMPDLKVTGCAFNGLIQQPDVSPFNDLAVGNQTQPPYQLTFGYVQVPATSISEAGDTTASVLLRDAVIERCLFQATTVPVLAMARLGSLRVEQNTVRDCYGGFWLVSLAGDQNIVMFDEVAIGSSRFYNNVASEGLAAWLDRIFVMATAMGRVLPTTPPSDISTAPGRIIIQPSDQLRTQARSSFASIYAAAAGSPAAAEPPVPPVPPAKRAPARSQAAAPAAAVEPAKPGAIPEEFNFIFNPQPTTLPGLLIPTAETGYGLILRLDVDDCQVDSVVANSYSGASLVVMDFTQNQASMLVHGCRFRTRFPLGEAAMFVWPVEATVTGNIIANEIVPPSEASSESPNSFSMTMFPLSPYGSPAVAITGNVFIDPTILPSRPSTIPQPLNDWNMLNTVIAYVAPPVVSGISPTEGSAGGGDAVTISGSGFTNASTVSFGPNAATAMTVNSDNQITATSPVGSGTVDVTVTTPIGTSVTSPADQFTYQIKFRPIPVPVREEAARPGGEAPPTVPSAEAAAARPSEAEPSETEPSGTGPAEAAPSEPKTPRQASKTPSTSVTRPMKRPDQSAPPATPP